MFRSVGAHGRVDFLASATPRSRLDTTARLNNFKSGNYLKMRLSTGLMGYIPMAELLALILATPIPWTRKWRALVAGVILATILAAFRVWVLVRYGYSGEHEAAMFALGPFARSLLDATYEVCAESYSFAFASPVVLWILITFRRDDAAYLQWPAPVHRDYHLLENTVEQ